MFFLISDIKLYDIMCILFSVPVCIKKGTFIFPIDPNVSVIMVGPGEFDISCIIILYESLVVVVVNPTSSCAWRWS